MKEDKCKQYNKNNPETYKQRAPGYVQRDVTQGSTKHNDVHNEYAPSWSWETDTVNEFSNLYMCSDNYNNYRIYVAQKLFFRF